MERWLTNPSQDNNQVPNYLPIRKRITRLQPIAVMPMPKEIWRDD
jgi:hypothetical protein